MRAAIIAAVIAAILVIVSPAVPSEPPVMASAQAISTPQLDSFYDQAAGQDRTIATFITVCTATSISTKEHYWMTAAHCFMEIDPHTEHFILGDLATIVAVDPSSDLAVVRTARASAPALKLAANEIQVGEAVQMAGYPLSFRFPLYNTGIASATRVMIVDGQREAITATANLFQMAGAPGNSGAPIVNSANELVSIEQFGWSRGWGAVIGGATLESLEKFRRYFD